MDTNNKHAYLITCHNNFDQLILLLKLLDDYRNDIYIHCDKKSNGFPRNKILNAVNKSSITIIKSTVVNEVNPKD